jgi:hypothetical protein
MAIGDTGRFLGLVLRPGQGRQQQRSKNRDNGNDDQQFDQSESKLTFVPLQNAAHKT